MSTLKISSLMGWWVVIIIALLTVLLSLLCGSTGWLTWAQMIEWRLPRVMASFAAGSLLASCGLVLQHITRNPLAEPYLLGVATSASFFSLLGVVLPHWLTGLGMLTILSPWLLPNLFGVIGAGFATVVLWLVYRQLIRGGGPFSAVNERLILLGVLMNSLMSALTTLLLTLSPSEQLAGLVFWMLGDTSMVTDFLHLIGLAFVFMIVMQYLAPQLHLMQLGDQKASTLGVSVNNLYLMSILWVSLGTGWVVVQVGPIGFIGLWVPHLLKWIGIEKPRLLFWATGWLGGAALCLIDLFSRSLSDQFQLPIGAVAALLGCPLIFLHLFRNRNAQY